MGKKFEKGEMVRVIGPSVYGADLKGTIVEVIDPEYTCSSGSVAVYTTSGKLFMPENLEKMAKSARILTEKILVNDIPCRKILGFEGILGRGELPEKYLEGSPMFCNEGVKRGHGHFEFDGEKLRYFGSENIMNIDIKVPRGKPPELDIGYFLMLNEGDVWPETTFQNILVWLKRAGSRLAKIRKQEKAAWSGKETVEI